MTRYKTAPSLQLSNLPDHLLASIAGYVTIPSQALLAVALTAPSSSLNQVSCVLPNNSQLTSASKGVLMVSGGIVHQQS